MDDSRDSSPYADKDTQGYDGENELPYQDSETDTASSQGSLDDETDEIRSSFSSKESKRDDNDMVTTTEFPEIVICDVCYKRFSDKEQLCVHRSIQSPPITYSCEECDIYFQTECTFETHKSFSHIPELFSPDKQN